MLQWISVGGRVVRATKETRRPRRSARIAIARRITTRRLNSVFQFRGGNDTEKPGSVAQFALTSLRSVCGPIPTAGRLRPRSAGFGAVAGETGFSISGAAAVISVPVPPIATGVDGPRVRILCAAGVLPDPAGCIPVPVIHRTAHPSGRRLASVCRSWWPCMPGK